jgi:hypothetical protein
MEEERGPDPVELVWHITISEGQESADIVQTGNLKFEVRLEQRNVYTLGFGLQLMLSPCQMI